MQTSILCILIVIVILLIILALLYWHFEGKKHKSYYLVSNEVVFQIRHPAATSEEELNKIKARIVKSMESLLSARRNDSQQWGVKQGSRVDKNWRKRLQPPTTDSRIITFPPQNDSKETFSLVSVSLVPFSLFPFRLTGHWKRDLSPNHVVSIINGAYAELTNDSLAIGEGISLQSISPNWFTKNLHHGGATGGPGSWPLEVQPPQNSGLWEHEFRVLGSTESLVPSGTVHIAILDTIPLEDFQSVAQSLMPASAVTSGLSPDYDLIQYLFLSGNLDIHRYNNPSYPTELTDLESYTPLPFHYKMPDHGTFIAGIIHSIASNATIHLYEVLNSFGLGTLTSVAKSLIDAVNNHNSKGDTPLIINCSFVLDPYTASGAPTESQLLNLTNPSIPGSPTASTLDVLRWITNHNNVVIVAAAGNEANSGTRPDAYYPAAYKGVVGVGALPKEYPTNTSGEYLPASYSNLSFHPNKPAGDGFMTFGGDIDNPGSLKSKIQPFARKGVLGVYMGEFPSRSTINGPITQKRSTDPTGWARWAGTSFAAPIITGLLASRWSGAPGQAISFAWARAELNGVNQGETDEEETVIQIQQGP